MSLLTPLLHFGIIIPLLILARIFSKKTETKYVILFGAYFLLDSYVRMLGFKYPELNFMGNYTGIIVSFAIAVIFISYHSKKTREEIGFTFKYNTKTLKFGIYIFLGFLIFDLVFKMIIFPKGGEFNLERFLFQATLPGLTEEIVFRGILLWILSKAFVPSKEIRGILFGWGFIIVTFTFAMVHGIALTEKMEVKVDYITIAYLTFVTSLSLGILRKFSGNLILPTIGHNVVNLMSFFIRLL